jgi:hypothetical protein
MIFHCEEKDPWYHDYERTGLYILEVLVERGSGMRARHAVHKTRYKHACERASKRTHLCTQECPWRENTRLESERKIYSIFCRQIVRGKILISEKFQSSLQIPICLHGVKAKQE